MFKSNKIFLFFNVVIIVVIVTIIAVNAWTNPSANPPIGSGSGAFVPAGAVMYFNLALCPTGWTALVAAQGRYLVGLPSAGVLAETVGTALTNVENRAVGLHNHVATQSSHRHSTGNYPDIAGGGAGIGAFATDVVPNNLFTDYQTPAITVDNAGLVPGTNAPYIQLLVCSKN